MRWSTLYCIFFILSVVSANIDDTNASPTESSSTPSDDVRPKRHLSTLLNIKKSIIGKVFGSSAPAESYKLYRIPGHDNILVKAVPIKTSENDGETLEVPTNPTIDLLESYLGTKTPDDTLKALDGVKNLLSSGIITNDALLNQILVPVQPPKIKYRVPQVSQLYPSVFHAPWAVAPQPLFVKTPEKPCAGKVAPRPVLVKKPVRVIPEAPVLQPLSFLPEVLVPQRPVVVKERPVLVKEFLDIPRVEIPDYRAVQVSKIPNKKPAYVKLPSSGFSYHQIKNDGTVTTFGGDSEIPFIVDVIPEAQRLPGVPVSIVEPVVEIPNNPATYGPVYVEKIPKNRSGFAYHQLHEDGSVTVFGDGSIPLARPAVLPSIVADRINIISEKVTDSKPEVFVGRPDGNPGYSYHQIKNDGTVTTYFGDGKKADSQYVQIVPESPRRPSLHVSDVFETEINTEYGPVKVQKIPKNPNGFSYHQMHTDGSETIYTGADVIPPIVRKPPKYSTLFLNRPVPSENRHPSFGPIVQLEKIPEQPGYSYQHLYTGGLASTYTGSNVTPLERPAGLDPLVADRIQDISEKITQTGNSGYSYNLIGDEETVTTIGGKIPNSPSVTIISDNNGKTPIPNPPYLSTLLNHQEVIVTEKNTPQQVGSGNSRYSYHQFNSDGTLTTYTGSEAVHTDSVTTVQLPVSKPTEAQTTSVQQDKEQLVVVGSVIGQDGQQYVNVFDVPNNDIKSVEVKELPKKPSSGFSYQQTNNDGSVNTYVGEGVKVTTSEIPAPPSLSNDGGIHITKYPCVGPNKCVVNTKVTFPTPVASTYDYTQLVRTNPNKKLTVVNIEDGLLRNQEASVTVTPVSVSHRQPSYLKRTRITSTEGTLASNPIVVPEKAGYSYKQTSSDGSTTKTEGSNQQVTVSVSGEVRNTVHRGDIPE